MKRKIFPAIFLLFFCAVCHGAPAAAGVPPVLDLAATTKTAIIIDPAHGGGDWGVNSHGTMEKEINLKIAKLLKAKIEKTEKDMAVYLTRDGDNFQNAADRAGFANSKKASVFISIHCDYAASQKVRGFKVYYQAGDYIAVKRQDTQVVSWDSAQLYYIDDSVKLAGYISQYMQAPLIAEEQAADGGEANDVAPSAYRKEAAANLNSLTGVDMPAVVFEAGNLNNSEDFGYLKDDRMLNRIAYHLKEGIMHYIREKEGK
jgi:N-acetylmuramoyl-L-alanine amidase